MNGRSSVAELISRKGWIHVGYDKTKWIPCPPGFRPDFTRDEWAKGFAQMWWDASGRKHGKREVRGFEKMLIAVQEMIYTEQPCHLALIHMPDVGYPPLALCFGIWQAIADPETQMRELVHAEDPVAIETPAVDEVWTEHLGRGLRSLYHQLLTQSEGVLAVLNYAWRSEHTRRRCTSTLRAQPPARLRLSSG